MKSDGEIVNNKEFEKFITQLIKGEEKRDI